MKRRLLPSKKLEYAAFFATGTALTAVSIGYIYGVLAENGVIAVAGIVLGVETSRIALKRMLRGGRDNDTAA